MCVRECKCVHVMFYLFGPYECLPNLYYYYVIQTNNLLNILF